MPSAPLCSDCVFTWFWAMVQWVQCTSSMGPVHISGPKQWQSFTASWWHEYLPCTVGVICCYGSTRHSGQCAGWQPLSWWKRGVKVLSSTLTRDSITFLSLDKAGFSQVALHDHSKSLPVVGEMDKLVQCSWLLPQSISVFPTTQHSLLMSHDKSWSCQGWASLSSPAYA